MPAAPDPFLVAALPFDVRPGEVARNFAQAVEGLERAADEGARLLALPEKWTTSFLPSFSQEIRRESDDALDRLHERAESLGVIVVGSAPGGEGEKPFNELHVLGPSGNLRPYRKRMLFSPTGEHLQNEPGSGPPPVIDTPLGRLSAVICYDLRFPEITRLPFYEHTDILVVPAQWPNKRTGIFELLTRARAAENQCWVLACNRAGVVAGPDGRDLAFLGNAHLHNPLGRQIALVGDGGMLLGQVDPEFTRWVRSRIPVREDLDHAGLGFGAPAEAGSP
jgi:predicted amidohydrolase